MVNVSDSLIDPLVAAPPRAREAVRGFHCEVDSVPHDAFDRIASAFDDVHHEQTACYAVRHWRGRDSHLMLRKDGAAVAGARVAIIALPLVGRGLAFLRFGPFWRLAGAAPDPAVYRAMVEALVEEYSVRRGLCLTILPRPTPGHHAEECRWLREAGFVQRREIMDPERYLVDVSLDETAQMGSLEQKWRYNLRHALANGLDIRLCETAEEIAAFQSLYAEMMARKKFESTTPVHLTGTLIAGLPERLKPKLVLAYHEGRPVAGATIGLFGDTAYYMFGASAADALPLKAGYALHWWIARWLCQLGVRWYDLGGAAHEPGLRQFKKGLVGKRGTLLAMEGEHDRWSGPVGRMAADLVFAARDLQRRLRHGRHYAGGGGT